MSNSTKPWVTGDTCVLAVDVSSNGSRCLLSIPVPPPFAPSDQQEPFCGGLDFDVCPVDYRTFDATGACEAIGTPIISRATVHLRQGERLLDTEFHFVDRARVPPSQRHLGLLCQVVPVAERRRAGRVYDQM